MARRHNESKFIRSFGKYEVEIYSALLCFFSSSLVLCFFCFLFLAIAPAFLSMYFRKEQTAVKATEAETVAAVAAAAVAYYAI